ncbi:hypothetical protein [Eikenella corrodens]|jgi:membrane protein|uniref:Uncharacterized protein n=1 Tax=Eikenella corrodens CC92I TaxID=1073362 RepID=V7IF77_EIKCO|nr:hypothetical protein [Eikenella corrodens]ETA83517.1 hypothetical protein HMPREF1177_01328 [Eikenella corrodens CC92I]
MKKALIAVIIVHIIFLIFILKFNFWLFDSMSRTFTPLSLAALELYGKILSGMGISWWLMRWGMNRNVKEVYQHPIIVSIIIMLYILILSVVAIPIASFAQNMLIKQIVRSSTYEDRADALWSFAATTTMVYPHIEGTKTEFSTWTKFKYLFQHDTIQPISGSEPDYMVFDYLPQKQKHSVLLRHAQSCRNEIGISSDYNPVDTAFFPFVSYKIKLGEAQIKPVLSDYLQCLTHNNNFFLYQYNSGILSPITDRLRKAFYEYQNASRKYGNAVRHSNRAKQKWLDSMSEKLGFRASLLPGLSSEEFFQHPDIVKYHQLNAKGIPLYAPDTYTATQAEQAELAGYFLEILTTKAEELHTKPQGMSAAKDELGRDYYRFIMIPFISLIASVFFIGINIGFIVIEICRYWFDEKQLKKIQFGLFTLFIVLPFIVGERHFEMEGISGIIVNWGYFYQNILAAVFQVA